MRGTFAQHGIRGVAPPRPALTEPAPRGWRAMIVLLVLLSVAGPFVFGLPRTSWQSGIDSNFALSLTRGYIQSLHAGVWFPRWLPDANAQFGSPVFYYYGRLPFLVAGIIGAALHRSAVFALIAAICIFRVAAFLSCRLWLRQRVSGPAADCGALTFIAFPFAMVFNSLTRVAPAEIAATAPVPLLFLLLDQGTRTWSTRAFTVAGLGVLYALLAWMHPLHLLLGCTVAFLYATLTGGFARVLLNIAGFLLGLLLGASSILPAIAMLPLINPGGWSGIPGVQLANNFLFSPARFRVYGMHDVDLGLYTTWFLCAYILLRTWRLARNTASEVRAFRTLSLPLFTCLLAMTCVAEPLWLASTRLQLVQFPWRLFPEAMTCAAALVALWLAREPARRKTWLLLLLCVMLVQLVLPATGAYLSFSKRMVGRPVSEFITHRVPFYVPSSRRDNWPNNTENTIEPEYLPRDAHRAGWSTNVFKSVLLAPAAALGVKAEPLPSALLSSHPDGSFTVQGTVASAQDVLLPLFFFPDEEMTAIPGDMMDFDHATGLVRLHLAAGPVDVRIDHHRPVPIVSLARRVSLLGLLLTGALLASAAGTRRRANPRVQHDLQGAGQTLQTTPP